MSAPELGKIGIWTSALRFGDKGEMAEAASELDELGFGTIWIPGGIDDAVLGDVDNLLGATSRATIATGIINVWKQEAGDVAKWYAGLSDDHKSRVFLGIGISHGPIIGEAWAKPLAKTRSYLEDMAAAGMAMDHTCVAALGPKMTQLAGELTAGSHPYLTSPRHTAEARDILGPGKIVAPEQGAIFATEPDKVRETGLAGLTFYRTLPNYRNNWKRLGFSEDEIENVSDRLIDALFPAGIDAIRNRVKEHHDAGADHVCLQVVEGSGVMGEGLDDSRKRWRELAAALF